MLAAGLSIAAPKAIDAMYAQRVEVKQEQKQAQRPTGNTDGWC